MKTISWVLTATSIALLSSGCAGNLMRKAGSELPSAQPEQVNIVFMRSSMVLAAISCDVFEVIDGELRFIGQLPTDNKIVYTTTPGKKVFMTYGMAADFMLADLKGGKTYYSIVRPNWGTSGFAPTPVRGAGLSESDSKEFRTMLSGTKLIEPKENAQTWFAKNKKRFQGIYEQYWKRFENKNRQEKADRTLLPEDGQ